MLVLDDYPQLRRRADELAKESERAAGRLQELKTQLKKQFGVSTIVAAKKLLAKLQKDELSALHEWNKAIKAFKKDYPELGEER